jgi:hypothetical protein
MEYANGLKALRQRLIEGSTGQAAPAMRGLESFVPSRAVSPMLQEEPDDLMARTASWMSDIKKASAEFKKAYNELSSQKRPAPNPFIAAAQGFLEQKEVMGEEKEEPTKSPEAQARSDSFIKARGETSPSTYAPTRLNEVSSFKQAIDLTEGGGDYDTLFAYSNREGKHFDGFKVSNMTIGEIKAFSDPNGEYGQWVKEQLRKSGKKARVATPMGRYQFVGSTLKALASEMGLDDNTVFTPEVQDNMFEHYLRKRISRGKTMDEKVNQVREAWEGFKSIPTSTLQNLISQYEAN